MEFLFSVADFECYEERKWKSNVYNRERLELKQKLLRMVKEIGAHLLSPDGNPLLIEASAEHPALWNHKQVDSQQIYLSRDEAARKDLDSFLNRQKSISSLLDDPSPQKNHVFLVVSLNYYGIEVSLKLHPDATVDRQNFERKIEDHFEAEKFIESLKGLPSSFQVGVLPKLSTFGSEDITLDKLKEWLSLLSKPGLALDARSIPFFCVSHFIPKQNILDLKAQFDAKSWVLEQLQKLLPLYAFIRWSRNNDYVSFRQVLDKEKAFKRQKGFEKGDKARMIRGMWAGKTGIVQEVDIKGQVRVLIGKINVKVDAMDVEKA